MNITLSIFKVNSDWKVVHPSLYGGWTHTIFSDKDLGGKVESVAKNFYKNQLRIEYQELYNLWKSKGLSEDRIYSMLEMLPNKELDYLDNLSNNPIHVQKHYPVSVLEKDIKWSSLPNKVKREVLWALGIDTKTGNYYYGDRLVFMKGEYVYDKVVYGNERTDRQWEISPYASQSLKDYMWNKRHGVWYNGNTVN